MAAFTKSFNQISRKDVEIAGGKGASLGEMSQAWIPVPDGFVVLSHAFDRFIEETGMDVEIDAALDEVDIKKMHTIENASEKIRAMILSEEIPKDIRAEIQKSYKKLGSRFVAVRSSATSEDSSAAAWAGQLESYLNTTEDTLLENIRRCWASLFTPRAIFYRFEKKLDKEHISVAVVVQRMVRSEKSGIAFSVHPVTQDKDQIIIEAGFGLGEAIVSGTITPDSYVVDKQGFDILDIKVNRQAKALYRKSKGGNEWRELGEKGRRQVLTNKEIVGLSKIIVRIENHYGFPCDIEWAEEKGKFYITQSRPITTISRTSQEAYRKLMTRPLTLVDCECWDMGERVKLPEKFRNLVFFDPLFIYTPGKGVAVYYNFTDPRQDIQPLIGYLEKNLPWFKKEKARLDRDCRKLRQLAKDDAADPRKIAELNFEIWPMVAVSNVIGSTDLFEVSDDLRGICIEARNASDKVHHPSLTYMNMLIARKLKIKDTQNISLTEFLNDNIPDAAHIRKRKKGWAYHKGKIIFDIKKYCKENNIQLIDPSKKHGDIIKGNTACKGFAKGKAKIVFVLSDLDKIKKGDILVAPMTTPEMIIALKKASAIVTDEGGVTCHAAIVSRELKMPCVIGTINATQLISDSDLLEVYADKGEVRIVKK